MEISDEVIKYLRREPKTESEISYRRQPRYPEQERKRAVRTNGNRERSRYSENGRKRREDYGEYESERRRAARVSGERGGRGGSRNYREEKNYYKKSLGERRYERAEDPYERYERYDRINAETTASAVLKKKKKKGKAKRVFTAILVILLILVVGLGVIWCIPSCKAAVVKAVMKSPFGPAIGRMIIGDSYEKYVRDKDFDESEVIIHDGVFVPDGNITVALFGVDARAEDLTSGTMSDSIVVVNADRNGNIKMASVFRDTYLMSRTRDGEEIISKANSAYYRGGPAGGINMLNENFDLAITDYVVVNFWGLANIIDIIGGLRLNISYEEMQELNYYMYEQSDYGGTEYVPLEEYGEDVLLTGDQATAFCRLRSVKFDSPLDGITYYDDYGRAARQRYTLTEMILQTRDLGVLKLMMLADKLFKANSGDRKFIQTSMDVDELIKLFVLGYDMNLAGSEGYPDLDHQYNAILDSGDSVVADTLEENVSLMHGFLYGIENYEPSEGLKKVAEQIRQEVARQIGY